VGKGLLVAAVFAVLVTTSFLRAFPPANRDQTQDRQSLLDLEEQWLNARDAGTLDRILASDFVHIAPGGYVLSKDEHIAWFEKHMPPANRNVRLEQVRVRIYGDTGIVNGLAINTGPEGKESRTAFTDVFVFCDGHWQAVNAQEDPVDSPH